MSEASGAQSYDITWVALDEHVLIVAVRSGGVNCGAYIGAVAGNDYGEEALAAVVTGSGASQLLTEVYFEGMAGEHVEALLGKEPYFSKDLFQSETRDIKAGNWPPRNKPKGVLEVEPLDKHVLAVALELPDNQWSARIGRVKGDDYWAESAEVAASGSRIPFKAAEVIFEDLGKATRKEELKWRGVEEVERVRAFGAGHE